MPKKGDRKAISKELAPVASKWHSVGLALKASPASLDAIDRSRRSTTDKLQSVIDEWLSGEQQQPPWKTLVNALKSQAVGERELAVQLESRFCSDTDSGSGPGETGALNLHNLIPIPLTPEQYHSLGQQFKIPEHELARIKNENRGNFNKRKRALFKWWLEHDRMASWESLLEVLDSVDSRLREQVEEEYGLSSSTESSRTRTSVHAAQPMKKGLAAGSSVKPVTMPVSAEEKASRVKSQMRATSPQSENSIVSVDRSSSSSYHSASNYEERFEALSPHNSNVEPITRRSLVQHDSPMHPTSKVSSTIFETPRQTGSGATAQARPTNGPQSKVSDRTPSEQTLAQQELEQSLAKKKAATLFCEAVRKWNEEEVEKMLAHEEGIDVDMVVDEKDGRTALMMAAAADKPALVRVLLKHRASTKTTDKEGCTALHLACSHGNYEVMKLLVAAFADVNAVTYDHLPMLLTPALKGFSMVTQYLLENGANPNIADKDGVTPLMTAARRGQRDVLKVLLSHRADAMAVSVKSSRTALQEAIDNNHQEIVPLLMKAMTQAQEKSRALFNCKTAEDVQELIRNNARVDNRRGDQATPLMAQVSAGNLVVVKELLAQGANVDLQDNEGESALMKASVGGHTELVQLIIAHRAILDLKSKSGYTALMYAVTNGHVGAVRELLLAGADPTARNNHGHSVLELAKASERKEVLKELEKHSSISDTKQDPFLHMLSGYLAQSNPSHQDTQVEVRSSSLTVDTRKETQPPAASVGEVGEEGEDGTLKEQLSKAWKRIADLETRVHDLTLQGTMDISDLTDLSYFDRERMEGEFRKMKEMKQKAEQYAVEAKQTAQRLSAENFKLKEDLSREQHLHELEKKNIMREMESKLGKKDGERERKEAQKEVTAQVIRRKAKEMAASFKFSVETQRVAVDPAFLQDCILNHKIRANFVLLAACGLPYSGKSTLTKLLLGMSGQSVPENIHGLTVYDALLAQDKVNAKSKWMESSKMASELFAISMSLLQVTLKHHQVLNLQSRVDTGEHPATFGDPQIDHYFNQVFQNLQHYLPEIEDIKQMLTAGSLTFMNVWDLGVNRGAFEVLSMLVPKCSNTIALNTFSVKDDAGSMNDHSNLGHPRYKGRYSKRGDDKNLMKLQSNIDYFFYPVCVLPETTGCALLVGTYPQNSLKESEVEQRAKKVLQMMNVKAEQYNREHCLLPRVATVQYQCDADIEKLQAILEGVINKNNYEVDMPLSWVFLRCFLAQKKDFFITMPELITTAKKCHICDREEIEEFLTVFVNCGSLIRIPNAGSEYAEEYIILNPEKFVEEVNKLYYIDMAKDSSGMPISVEDRNEHSQGCVSETLASRLWDKEDGSDSLSKFFLHALCYLRVLTPLTSQCASTRGYFMPTLGPKANPVEPSNNSLYLNLRTLGFPFPLQSEFLVYFQSAHPKEVLFEKTDFFNTLKFKFQYHDKSYPEQVFYFHFMGNYIEVAVDGNLTHALCSLLKTACVQVMNQIQCNKPELKVEYSFAIKCAASDVSDIHFVAFHPLEDGEELVSQSKVQLEDGTGRSGDGRGQGNGGMGSDQRIQWLQASYTGPRSLVQYPSDILTPSEAAALANTLSILSEDDFSLLVSALGFSPEEVEAKRHPGCSQKDLILRLLLEYSNRTPCNVKKRLGKVMWKCGHVKEALKLDPSSLKHFTSPPDSLSKSELRAVSLHLSQWEEVGRRLTVPQNTLSQYKKSARTTYDMAYKMLLDWSESYQGGGAREKLCNELKAVGCSKSAEFLMLSDSSMLWK